MRQVSAAGANQALTDRKKANGTLGVQRGPAWSPASVLLSREPLLTGWQGASTAPEADHFDRWLQTENSSQPKGRRAVVARGLGPAPRTFVGGLREVLHLRELANSILSAARGKLPLRSQRRL